MEEAAAAAPYRAPAVEPDAAYPVRTPKLYWLVQVAFAVFGVCALIGLVVCLVDTGSMQSTPWTLVAPLAFLALLPVAQWFGSAAYRIPGGQGAIRFFPDHLELPDVDDEPLRLARAGLAVRATEMRVRLIVVVLPLPSIRRGVVLRFTAPGVRRVISTLLLEDKRQERPLLADLERFQRGGRATGLEAAPEVSAVAAPRNAYDDAIDRELSAMDD